VYCRDSVLYVIDAFVGFIFPSQQQYGGMPSNRAFEAKRRRDIYL